eukprot:CAMPEP_0198586196 /NCGR_PEP_ID=MMETSP1462-20131121/130310_1 /TAXON_ID=1333877 /ORGANISM="Brandtodinium nutriculum, Strain RCC3387" /LENGTH=78 /DNA_ID=CAMNT_0044317649 /DNA_START=92 /DNA_END=326 /DNA_ORIENTATION=-
MTGLGLGGGAQRGIVMQGLLQRPVRHDLQRRKLLAGHGGSRVPALEILRDRAPLEARAVGGHHGLHHDPARERAAQAP